MGYGLWVPIGFLATHWVLGNPLGTHWVGSPNLPDPLGTHGWVQDLEKPTHGYPKRSVILAVLLGTQVLAIPSPDFSNAPPAPEGLTREAFLATSPSPPLERRQGCTICSVCGNDGGIAICCLVTGQCYEFPCADC